MHKVGRRGEGSSGVPRFTRNEDERKDGKEINFLLFC